MNKHEEPDTFSFAAFEKTLNWTYISSSETHIEKRRRFARALSYLGPFSSIGGLTERRLCHYKVSFKLQWVVTLITLNGTNNVEHHRTPSTTSSPCSITFSHAPILAGSRCNHVLRPHSAPMLAEMLQGHARTDLDQFLRRAGDQNADEGRKGIYLG